MTPADRLDSRENVVSDMSRTRPVLADCRSSTVHRTEPPVATSVTVTTVPKARVGLAQPPGVVSYHDASPVRACRGGGGAGGGDDGGGGGGGGGGADADFGAGAGPVATGGDDDNDALISASTMGMIGARADDTSAPRRVSERPAPPP